MTSREILLSLERGTVWNADEHLHGFAKQVGLAHSSIGDFGRPVVEFIIGSGEGSDDAKGSDVER